MRAAVVEIHTRGRTIIVSRAGRRRKQGNREPNGKPQRVYINHKAQVASQPHRIVVAESFRAFPEAGSDFGCLMLNKHITPAQHEAGRRYAMDATAYRAQILGAPSPDPRGCDPLRASGGGAEVKPEVARAIRDAYNRAFEAVNNAGNRAARAVKEYAVFGKKLDVADGYSLKLLILGLDRLVLHYGVDKRLQITVRPK
ncbi:hypothetical protein UFOVP1349_5 [uncultured Caudovirales phage]|uniref:Uncharacterized protein n=1 Tax=uncultured Caudovirales phage TaxID=2100421 RepID=A0A6J5PRJ2_9CAUD|nr:hypothetical protein UFOVP925_38 [uncultured Caudovirales phage]CAB4183921.1 hypothetical protein UFOVP1097_11 [uncultured Caudovirales phage]CAB4199643.1 hypothetical protein UFOVP1349_5 [uncultured Caudovirales phage]CAB4214501.1 hypothetical protein UFOVP1456_42 [uncultured Caudovirales phage]